MKSKTKRKYEDRTFTMNFNDEATYHRLRMNKFHQKYVVLFIEK